MAQTIKKLLNYYLTQYPITEYLELFKNIIFDDILKAHEKELAKKYKEHKEQLKRMYEQFKHYKELEIGQYKFEIEQQQLFKEDFTEFYVCEQHGINLDNCKCNINNTNDNFRIRWLLKDNSKYEKLESKEE